MTTPTEMVQDIFEVLGGWTDMQLYMGAESWECFESGYSYRTYSIYTLKITIPNKNPLLMELGGEFIYSISCGMRSPLDACFLGLKGRGDRLEIIRRVEKCTGIPVKPFG